MTNRDILNLSAAILATLLSVVNAEEPKSSGEFLSPELPGTSIKGETPVPVSNRAEEKNAAVPDAGKTRDDKVPAPAPVPDVKPSDDKPVAAANPPSPEKPVGGGNQPADEKTPEAATAPRDVKDDGILLSENACIEIAILNNLKLQISRLDDRQSDIAVRDAMATYFPTFTVTPLHQNSRLEGHTAKAPLTSLTATIHQDSPWGTQMDLSMSEGSTRDARSGQTGNIHLDVRQPLWRGLGTDRGLAQWRTARIDRLISRGKLDLDLQTLIFQVRQGYANIIEQLQNRDVNREAVRSAQKFLELTDAREKAGQVTKLDVFNSQVQLRDQELTLLTNERLLESAMDLLKQLMNIDLTENIKVEAPIVDFGETPEAGLIKELRSDDPSGTISLIAYKDDASRKVVSSKLLFQGTHFEEKRVLDEALANRVDLLNQRRQIAVQKIQVLLTKNGLGHQIDLVGSIGRSDKGRVLVERDNHSEVNDWRVGLQATFPWGNIHDRALYEVALLDLQKAEIALKEVNTQVQVDVRNVLRTLRQEEKALLIEAQKVEQAKRSVDAARISFDRGLKDSFDVIKVQNDFLTAKRDFIARKLAYVVDLADLERKVGKPTGRVNLEGQSVGGLIDAKIPDEFKGSLPQMAPDPVPTELENPLNESRAYRKDYKPDTRHPPVVEVPEK